MVIVDSDVWSEAFRKKGEVSLSVHTLRNLITEGEVTMIGPIRQEILSGIKETERYEKIKDALRAFPSQRIEEPSYEMAASFFNRCRIKGIQGSHTDYLICACAIVWKARILTKDKDFTRYAKYLPIELHEAKE
ncbi:PIN domain-containing protein [bacterium]|jgi:predicted nucleic acid-binding protein|nr:PIN domain-containing protein [bacterium]MDB4746163.1 PIN domain-containing protein [Verrucomicrobiota bacterium]